MRDLEHLRRRYADHVPGLLGARHSYAVLCPLVERPDGLHLLFEVRSAALHRQPGEVCFPGGRMEAGETPEQCALRETEEELVSAAGFAAVAPSPAEVGEAFTVPLAFFRETAPEQYVYALQPDVPGDFPYETVGIPADYRWARGRVEVPIWYWQGHAVWGMTARLTQDIIRHLE